MVNAFCNKCNAMNTYREQELVRVVQALGSQQVQVWEQLQQVPVQVVELQQQAPPPPSFQQGQVVPAQP
jgi:hypothetical protein